MVAKKAFIPARGTYTIGETNEPFNPTKGGISFSSQEPRNASIDDDDKLEESNYSELLEDNQELQDYLKVASLANLAHVHQTQEGGWNARGDPTEIAIQVFASRFKGWNRRASVAGPNALQDTVMYEMLAEFPFDSDVKKMSVLYKNIQHGQMSVFTKGAVERVIASCTSYVPEAGAKAVEMTDKFREQILENMEGLAKLGIRVLA